MKASPHAADLMDTARVGAQALARIERAEAEAWADLYAAAPSSWAAAAGLATESLGGALVLRWAASGRRYFNRAIALATSGPATEQGLDAILACWREHGIEMFLVQSMPGCRPGELESWLRERGLRPFDAQDRIVRGAEPLDASPGPAEPSGDAAGLAVEAAGLVVEPVGPANVDEWSQFVQHSYRLDTGPWLPELVGRAGWHQYVARRDGEIVAARGMHVIRGGLAWLGMDAPVPGLRTGDYDPDAALCAFIVRDGLSRGARGFIADIEVPSPRMDTPAYEHFGRLGFRRPYVRTHWTAADTL